MNRDREEKKKVTVRDGENQGQTERCWGGGVLAPRLAKVLVAEGEPSPAARDGH